MKKYLEFIGKIRAERDMFFEEMINNYTEAHKSDNFWNGPSLRIERKSDFFLILSEDKKSLSIKWDEFDPNINFSYIIYFSYYLHVANYTNGGLNFFGFYDKEFKKVNEIPFEEFKIVKCSGGCSFIDKNTPMIHLSLKHKDGNEHSAIRGNAYNQSDCQKSLDSIWELEDFYKKWTKRVIESPRIF